jgi:HPt (histidine-containing phosphotransfer) domain-containing protein
MDAVLTKPIDPEQLLATVHTVVEGIALASASPGAQEKVYFEDQPQVANLEKIELPVWDQGALVRVVGKNPVIQHSLLRQFLQDADLLVAATDVCVGTARYQDAAGQAHKLKSSARTVGAMRLGACCAALEQAGSADSAAECTSLALQLRQELARVEGEMVAAKVIQKNRLQGE